MAKTQKHGNKIRKTGKNAIRKSRNRDLANQRSEYESLEKRQVLAALFPTWVNGVFTLGDSVSGTPYNLADTFSLASLPTAERTIYLDFDGHHSVGNSWNHDIVFPMYDRDGDNTTFSDAELIEIQKIFQNVAEDFLPFEVNVTTTDPGVAALSKSDSSDTTWGVRVIHTQATGGFGNGIGGVAFLNSFPDSIDNPCFAFNKGVNNGAMTISHEVGHTLGLRHDGLNGSTYHPGAGSGATGWGPIMGAPFGKNLVQWSKGEYVGATRTEDDLAIITMPANGTPYRADDVGDSIATAKPLSLDSDTTAFDWGIIGQNSDVDFYSLDVGAGLFKMDLLPFQENPNLDVLATLYDADGNVVATSNPVDDLTASFNIPDIAAGRYYVSIDGVGKPGDYTDYGSMGLYTITANFVDPFVIIGESGTIESLREHWVTINLTQDYFNPVVVAGPATRIGGHQLTVRVRNVTSNSFEIALDEWDYLDGRHSFEQVSYVVMEAGTHTLEDGTVIQAGSQVINHAWSGVTFPQFFGDVPMLFTQTMSYNDTAAVTTRVKSIINSGFQFRLQEEQAAVPQHGNEVVGWIAITPGQGVNNGIRYESFRTAVDVDHTDYTQDFLTDFEERPVFLANMQSFYGGDVATVRLRQISDSAATFFVEEERSFDYEIAHNRESIGYFAMDPGPLGVYPPSGPAMMRAAGGSGNGLFTQVTTDPSVIASALKQIEQWGEDSYPLDNHDDGGACCCAGCLGQMAGTLDTNAMLAATLFARSSGSEAASESIADLPAFRMPVVPASTLELSGASNVGASLDQSFIDRSRVFDVRPAEQNDSILHKTEIEFES